MLNIHTPQRWPRAPHTPKTQMMFVSLVFRGKTWACTATCACTRTPLASVLHLHYAHPVSLMYRKLKWHASLNFILWHRFLFFFWGGGVHKALPTYAPMKPKTQRRCCKHLQEKDWKSPRIREEKNSLLFFLDYRGGNVISLLLNSQDYFIKKKICIYVSQPQINHFPSSFSSHNDLYAARLNPFFVLQIEALTHTMKSRIHTWWWHPCSLYISFF